MSRKRKATRPRPTFEERWSWLARHTKNYGFREISRPNEDFWAVKKTLGTGWSYLIYVNHYEDRKEIVFELHNDRASQKNGFQISGWIGDMENFFLSNTGTAALAAT